MILLSRCFHPDLSVKPPRNRSPWADSPDAGPASPQARTTVADRHPPAPSVSGAAERLTHIFHAPEKPRRAVLLGAHPSRVWVVASRRDELPAASRPGSTSPDAGLRRLKCVLAGRQNQHSGRACSPDRVAPRFLPSRAQTPFGHALVPATPLPGEARPPTRGVPPPKRSFARHGVPKRSLGTRRKT